MREWGSAEATGPASLCYLVFSPRSFSSSTRRRRLVCPDVKVSRLGLRDVSTQSLFVDLDLPPHRPEPLALFKPPSSPAPPPSPPASIMAAVCRVSWSCCLLVLLVLPTVRSSFPRSGADCGPGKAADCPGEKQQQQQPSAPVCSRSSLVSWSSDHVEV